MESLYENKDRNKTLSEAFCSALLIFVKKIDD